MPCERLESNVRTGFCTSECRHVTDCIRPIPKAVLKSPQSRRSANSERPAHCAKRLECVRVHRRYFRPGNGGKNRTSACRHETGRIRPIRKAVLKSPQSRRSANPERSTHCAKRLECVRVYRRFFFDHATAGKIEPPNADTKRIASVRSRKRC